jgi:hypothetical protein
MQRTIITLLYLLSLQEEGLAACGNPHIKMVRYPAGRNPIDETFTTSSHQTSKDTFTTLAVLLHQSESFFDDYKTTNQQKIKQRTPALKPAWTDWKLLIVQVSLST